MAEPPSHHLANISPRAQHIIQTLRLTYLPHESGYIGILPASPHQVTTQSGRTLAAQSHNYYMLTRALPINYLHHLESDDAHILIEGGSVEYCIFHPNGTAEKRTLGRAFERGETGIISIPGGCWKALKLCDDEVDYALTGNVLAPEFTEDRVRIGFQNEGEQEEWLRRYEGKAEWASREFLNELIGPNRAKEIES